MFLKSIWASSESYKISEVTDIWFVYHKIGTAEPLIRKTINFLK